MIKYRGIGCVPLVVLLQLVAPPAVGDQAPFQYRYSDEWTLVSAPPPAGPYRSVNIDPRVPGAGAVTTMPMNIRMPETAEEAPAGAAVAEAMSAPAEDRSLEPSGTLPEDAMTHPPAAGIAAPLPEIVTPLDAVSDAWQQHPGSRLPAPGYYGRMMPPPPAFNYPTPMRYPRQAGYPGYPNMPPFGYYNPPVRSQEPEVPPPPEYYQRQRGYGDMR